MTTPGRPTLSGSSSEMSPVWIEAALNGAWTKERQPLIPTEPADIIREGVACAALGAAIIHVHAYDADGRPCEDVDIYTRIVEGNRGLLEWVPIDPGSVNINSYASVASGIGGHLYINSDAHIRRGLTFAAEAGLHPTFAIYEPGFIRMGAALASSTPGLSKAVYRLMFTAGRAWGFPAEEYALAAYSDLLRREAPDAPWMIAGHDVNLTALVPSSLSRGGFLRVGLEDAPHGSAYSNEAWVQRAVDIIETERRSVASAVEVRQALRTSHHRPARAADGQAPNSAF